MILILAHWMFYLISNPVNTSLFHLNKCIWYVNQIIIIQFIQQSEDYVRKNNPKCLIISPSSGTETVGAHYLHFPQSVWRTKLIFPSSFCMYFPLVCYYQILFLSSASELNLPLHAEECSMALRFQRGSCPLIPCHMTLLPFPQLFFIVATYTLN